MKRSWYIPVVLSAMTLFLTVCDSKGPLPSPDVIPPTVRFVSPGNGSVNIPVNLSAITISFSEAMDRSSLNSKTITLVDPSGPRTVSGTVKITDSAGLTVDLYPSVNLNPSTLYRIVVSTGVKDRFGNAMGAPFTASFYTGTVADTTPPVVTATYPASNATGVSVNSSPRVTFSEQVIPQTISCTLSEGTGSTAVPVPGTLNYSGTTAVLTPSMYLISDTQYTMTVSAGVMDLSGNPMPADYTWTFRTKKDTNPPTVSTTLPLQGATGVGVNVSPNVTFNEPVILQTISFTLTGGTSTVSGTITYSGTTALFMPSNILASDTLYTATVSGVQDLAGNLLAGNQPNGDYQWTFRTLKDSVPPYVTSSYPTGPAGVNVNLSPSITFSEPVLPAITFTLISASTGTVPGTTQFNGNSTTAVFTPFTLLAYNTQYAVTVSGVQDLAGNPLAAAYSWTFTTVQDLALPVVSSTFPVNGASNVVVNISPSVTFSKSMDPATITGTTFMLSSGGTPVPGTIQFSGMTAIFTPSSNLAKNASNTVTLVGGVNGIKDLAGNLLTGNQPNGDYQWTFTTGKFPDTTAPVVSASMPADGVVNVGVNISPTVTFSEFMDPTTVTNTTFTLIAGGVSVPGTVAYSGLTAVFTPSHILMNDTVYTATVSNVQDLAGNPLAAPYVWTFTTVQDTTPPSLVLPATPAAGEQNVSVNHAISVTFSEPVDPSTIQFILQQSSNGANIPVNSIEYTGVTAIFTPLNILAQNTQYTATISAGVQDLAGNTMTSGYSWTFTTGMIQDSTAPVVVAPTMPAAGDSNVSIHPVLSITFSEPVKPSTIGFTLTRNSDNAVIMLNPMDYTGTTAIFTAVNSLAAGTTYTATVNAGVQDLAGNPMSAGYTWMFTTAQDVTAPTIVLPTFPANNATVGVNTPIIVTFSEAMDPLSIISPAQTFVLLDASAASITCTQTYSGTTAVYIPTSVLVPGMYTATIVGGANGVTDLSGNPLAADYTWTFIAQ